MFSTISLFCLQNDRKHFVPVELVKSIPAIYCGAKVLLYHRESHHPKIFSLAMYVLKCFNKTHGEWLKNNKSVAWYKKESETAIWKYLKSCHEKTSIYTCCYTRKNEGCIYVKLNVKSFLIISILPKQPEWPLTVL